MTEVTTSSTYRVSGRLPSYGSPTISTASLLVQTVTHGDELCAKSIVGRGDLRIDVFFERRGKITGDHLQTWDKRDGYKIGLYQRSKPAQPQNKYRPILAHMTSRPNLSLR